MSSPPKRKTTIQIKKSSSAQESDQVEVKQPLMNVMQDFMPYLRGEDREELSNMLAEEEEEDEEGSLAPVFVGVFLAGIAAIASQNPAAVQSVENFFADPTTTLQAVVDSIGSMGDLGLVYFAVVYTIAEVLAIPAIPLTASAGYLFGVTKGTAIVLLSGSIAAAVGFLIGRFFLREKVEKILQEYPKFQAVDRVIGKEGFKIMILLRLSPIFPFALSNYLYGVTSVEFWPYFWGTMIGFAPGTAAYVYTGTVGKALTLDAGNAEPWYFYAAILVAATGILKVVADVATGVIESLDEEADT